MTTPDRDDLHAPVRTCIGCRTRRASDVLVRVTRVAGNVAVDGSSAGRGAWLCRDLDGAGVVAAHCLDEALRRKAFARAWRTSLDPDDERVLRAELGGARR